MRFLRQSTSVDLPVGPFLDSIDGVTAETALTITQPDIRLKKNGGAWAQKNAAQTLLHEENGNYEVTLDATDTNTLGQLRLHIAESGALPVWDDFTVIPANIYDSLIDNTDKLDVNVEEWNATAVPSEHTAGYPIVTVKDGTGTGEIDTSSGGVTLSAAERNATADAFLDRNMATGTDSGSASVRTVRQALRALRNKLAISGSTMTVNKEDDATASWTATLTTNASADPITTVDPA